MHLVESKIQITPFTITATTMDPVAVGDFVEINGSTFSVHTVKEVTGIISSDTVYSITLRTVSWDDLTVTKLVKTEPL